MAIKDVIEKLEPGLQIDEDALDEALQRGPDLFYRVSKELALAISRRDAAKQSLAEGEAKADTAIREDMERNDEKVREAAVTAQKLTYPEVVRAMKTLHQFNTDVGLLAALKEAYQQRSYALSSLVDLYTSGYFAEVSGKSSEAKAKDIAASKAKAALKRVYLKK